MCNLDNTALIIRDGPNASHGTRQIIKNVERKAIQLIYEHYSPDNGWSGQIRKYLPELIDL